MQKSQLPCDIGLLVDLASPILKYLVEIEKKFWRSHTNAAFKHFSQITREQCLDDSEASLESLRGVHTYALASQNEKRLKPEYSIKAKLRLLQADDRGRRDAPALKSLPRDSKFLPDKPLAGLIDTRPTHNGRSPQPEVLVVPASLGRKHDTSYSKPVVRNPAASKTFFNPSQKNRLAAEALQANTNHRRDVSRDMAADYEANRLKLQRVVKESAVDILKQPRGLDSRSKSPYELNRSSARPLVVTKPQPSLQYSYSSLLNGSSVGQRSPQRTQHKQRTAIVRLKDSREALVPSNTSRGHLQLSNVQFNFKYPDPPGSFKPPPTSGSHFNASNYLLIHNHPNPPAKLIKQRTNVTDRRLVPSSSRSGLDSLQLSGLKDKSLLNIKKTVALKAGLRQSPRLEATAAPEMSRTTNKLLYSTIQDRLAGRHK